MSFTRVPVEVHTRRFCPSHACIVIRVSIGKVSATVTKIQRDALIALHIHNYHVLSFIIRGSRYSRIRRVAVIAVTNTDHVQNPLLIICCYLYRECASSSAIIFSSCDVSSFSLSQDYIRGRRWRNRFHPGRGWTLSQSPTLPTTESCSTPCPTTNSYPS